MSAPVGAPAASAATSVASVAMKRASVGAAVVNRTTTSSAVLSVRTPPAGAIPLEAPERRAPRPRKRDRPKKYHRGDVMRQMQGFGRRFSASARPALVAVTAALFGAAGCGSNGEPGSSTADFSALERAPEPLGSLYAKGDALLPGGVPAFERHLRELRGTPVVVNKWASW